MVTGAAPRVGPSRRSISATPWAATSYLDVGSCSIRIGRRLVPPVSCRSEGEPWRERPPSCTRILTPGAPQGSFTPRRVVQSVPDVAGAKPRATAAPNKVGRAWQIKDRRPKLSRAATLTHCVAQQTVFLVGNVASDRQADRQRKFSTGSAKYGNWPQRDDGINDR